MASIIRTDALQNLNTSNIISQTNATTLTIGASGQTISLASGASSSGFGATYNSGLNWTSTLVTSALTVSAGVGYFVNTSTAAITLTLPASPTFGNIVGINDYSGYASTNNITVNPNGNKLEGGTDNKVISTNKESVFLTYTDTTRGWLPTSGVNNGTDALSPLFNSAEYLVVAGGGGGGGHGGGGGGAGGFGTGTLTGLSKATNYTVTVGGGGAAGNNSNGTQGSSSVFSTITSTGGGYGGGNIPTANPGGNGGSGGGGGGSNGSASIPGGTGNTPSTTPSQGNNGGTLNNPAYAAGGGGGAGAVGSNGVGSPANGGNGGNGTASSITGSSVTYAGGGGGSAQSGTQGTGGTGGGGAGVQFNPANPGTANTGGGGGGNHAGPPSPGGAGGSGIVILKYLSSVTISNPGGGLTFSTTTSSGFSITSFTAGTGNVQWN
jgi:hypothetical protein